MKIFRRLFGFMSAILMLAFNFVRSNIVPAVDVTDLIREAIENPEMDVLVRLTETRLDDAILDGVRASLRKYASDCGVGSDVDPEDAPPDLIQQMVDYMRGLSEVEQGEWLRAIASRLANEVRPHVYSQYVVDTLVQVYYASRKEGMNLSRFSA